MLIRLRAPVFEPQQSKRRFRSPADMRISIQLIDCLNSWGSIRVGISPPGSILTGLGHYRIAHHHRHRGPTHPNLRVKHEPRCWYEECSHPLTGRRHDVSARQPGEFIADICTSYSTSCKVASHSLTLKQDRQGGDGRQLVEPAPAKLIEQLRDDKWRKDHID